MQALETFTIPEANLSLYPVDDTGLPVTDNPVWLGANAKGIRITERKEEVEDRPTGSRYPQRHHIAEQHEISVEKLFIVSVPDDLPVQPSSVALVETVAGGVSVTNSSNYQMRDNQQYILVIMWATDDNPDRYYHRTYFGVMDRSHDIGATGEDGAFDASIVWSAQYYI